MLHMVTPVQQAHHVPLFRQVAPPPSDDLRRQIVGMVRTSDEGGGPKTTAILYDLRERQLVSRISRKLADLSNKRESLQDRSRVVDPERKLLEAKAELGGPDPNSSRRLERLSASKEGRLMRKLSAGRDGRALLPDRFRRQPGPTPSPAPYLRHDPRDHPRHHHDLPSQASDRVQRRPSPPGRSRDPHVTPSPPRGAPGAVEGGVKRSSPSYGLDRRSPRPKSVRFRHEDVPGRLNSSSSSDTKSGGKTGEETCEIKGSAISTASSRHGSPAKRTDSATMRNTTYSASLDMFRRRLRLNQTRFLQTREGSEDYVIKRAENNQRFRSPSPQPLRARHTPHPPMRPTPEHLPEESSRRVIASRSSFRNADHAPDEKQSPMPLGEGRAMPKVKTYVLEAENQCQALLQQRSRVEEPVALTAHNLDVHNMLQELHKKSTVVSDPDLGFSCDFRLMRWLEETNTHNRIQRMVRFNISVPSGHQVEEEGDGDALPKTNTTNNNNNSNGNGHLHHHHHHHHHHQHNDHDLDVFSDSLEEI